MIKIQVVFLIFRVDIQLLTIDEISARCLLYQSDRGVSSVPRTQGSLTVSITLPELDIFIGLSGSESAE